MSDPEDNKQVVANSLEPSVNKFTNFCKRVKKKYEDVWWVLGVAGGIAIMRRCWR
jgi:hypothetical protein